MFKISRRYKSENSKKRILSACVRLFIEKGYNNTTVAEILKEADVTSSTFQNIFHTKDGVLECLTEFMFLQQFDVAGKVAEKGLPPVFVYAVETAIQLTLAELNENLRDVYVEAYTYQKTADYIHQRTSSELHRIFGEYLPEYGESDFYELEIGTSGMMRNYMVKRCDKYFTLEKKLKRFLSASLGVYNVPRDEQSAVIEYIMGLNIRETAGAVMRKLFESLAMRFEFELGEDVIEKSREAVLI